MIGTLITVTAGFYAGSYATDKLNLKFDTIAAPFVKLYTTVKEIVDEDEKSEKDKRNNIDLDK